MYAEADMAQQMECIKLPNYLRQQVNLMGQWDRECQNINKTDISRLTGISCTWSNRGMLCMCRRPSDLWWIVTWCHQGPSVWTVLWAGHKGTWLWDHSRVGSIKAWRSCYGHCTMAHIGHAHIQGYVNWPTAVWILVIVYITISYRNASM